MKKPTTRATREPSAATYFYRSLTFAAAADAYVQAYDQHADGWTTGFLLGRALELSLKAILRADGLSSRILAKRRFGHDLHALAQECSARSIVVVDPDIPDTDWGLRQLSNAYNSKELEYQEHGKFSGPTPYLLRRLVHFSIHVASTRAVAPTVLTQISTKSPGEPGFTLIALDAYR